MPRSKKIFIILAAIFLAIMIYFGIDIANKTTFPGSNPNLKERISPSNK